MSSRVNLLFPPHDHEPPPTLRGRLNPHLSLERGRFPVLRYTKRPDVALYAIGPLFLVPPRPLRTSPSRFPNTICFFGSRPPLIRMSVLAHKSLLVRNVVSMLSHAVISKARLYEVIRWSGLFVLHTYINRHFFKKNMNASRPPSEHPPVRGEMSKRLGGIVGYKDKTSSLDLNGFPYGSNIGSTV